MAADAKRLPSAESDYRNKNLNQRVQQTSPFIAESVWRACAGPVDDDAFARGPVYHGARPVGAQRPDGAGDDRARCVRRLARAGCNSSRRSIGIAERVTPRRREL